MIHQCELTEALQVSYCHVSFNKAMGNYGFIKYRLYSKVLSSVYKIQNANLAHRKLAVLAVSCLFWNILPVQN